MLDYSLLVCLSRNICTSLLIENYRAANGWWILLIAIHILCWPVTSLCKFILFLFYLPVDRTKDGTRGGRKNVYMKASWELETQTIQYSFLSCPWIGLLDPHDQHEKYSQLVINLEFLWASNWEQVTWKGLKLFMHLPLLSAGPAGGCPF